MFHPTLSMSLVSFESTQGQTSNMAPNISAPQQPPLGWQNGLNCDGPVAVLWDIENCPVPNDVRPEDVAGNIRMALRVHPMIRGAVMMFSAYGDFNAFPRRLREGCQRTGVKLIDVPNGRKDAADKAILVDMFLFALDNRPPSSIMLISGDVDFAPALHILGQRGYVIILVIPSTVGVSSALSNSGAFVWDWQSIARGEGFVPQTKTFLPSRGVPHDVSRYLMVPPAHDNQEFRNEEESIVYQGIAQNYSDNGHFSMASQSLSGHTSMTVAIPCFPSGLNEVQEVDQSDPTSWVQPGDLNGLKGQFVKLLELSGGLMPLTRVPAEYQRLFGRPLYVNEYGACRLVNLLKKMDDSLAVDGKSQKKFVYLRNLNAGPNAGSPTGLQKKDNKKGKRMSGESVDVIRGSGSSNELSDDVPIVAEELHEMGIPAGKDKLRTKGTWEVDPPSLEQFKQELEEILVCYSCSISLAWFEAIYEQRYGRALDYPKFGVNQLEELLQKMGDVVSLHEDPVSKEKFMSATGG
ncbi:hypothetical protein MLD38_013787 [Melastoma candidum]|uniref:Uncharacterized protein n=1 Tax=Melastoma candidum TaxID=119954 RepID=A0ACB9RDU2_9MYRT|nr:hypothetical protein MLD38_013787 [Melastoma candidum]